MWRLINFLNYSLFGYFYLSGTISSSLTRLYLQRGNTQIPKNVPNRFPFLSCWSRIGERVSSFSVCSKTKTSIFGTGTLDERQLALAPGRLTSVRGEDSTDWSCPGGTRESIPRRLGWSPKVWFRSDWTSTTRVKLWTILRVRSTVGGQSRTDVPLVLWRLCFLDLVPWGGGVFLIQPRGIYDTRLCLPRN